MFGIPSVIFVVVIAVALFMYFRNKGKNTASDSSIESVSAQKISPEPEEAIEVSSTAEASVIEGITVSSLPLSGIPEDSALRRHFIQQLSAEIEVTMPERPTDSTLKRHYDAQLLDLVDSKLDALK